MPTHEERDAHLSKSGTTVMGLINFLLTVLKAHVTGKINSWHYKPILKPLAKEVIELKDQHNPTT